MSLLPKILAALWNWHSYALYMTWLHCFQLSILQLIKHPKYEITAQWFICQIITTAENKKLTEATNEHMYFFNRSYSWLGVYDRHLCFLTKLSHIVSHFLLLSKMEICTNTNGGSPKSPFFQKSCPHWRQLWWWGFELVAKPFSASIVCRGSLYAEVKLECIRR